MTITSQYNCLSGKFIFTKSTPLSSCLTQTASLSNSRRTECCMDVHWQALISEGGWDVHWTSLINVQWTAGTILAYWWHTCFQFGAISIAPIEVWSDTGQARFSEGGRDVYWTSHRCPMNSWDNSKWASKLITYLNTSAIAIAPIEVWNDKGLSEGGWDVYWTSDPIDIQWTGGIILSGPANW